MDAPLQDDTPDVKTDPGFPPMIAADTQGFEIGFLVGLLIFMIITFLVFFALPTLASSIVKPDNSSPQITNPI